MLTTKEQQHICNFFNPEILASSVQRIEAVMKGFMDLKFICADYTP